MRSIELPIGSKFGRLEIMHNSGVRKRHMYYTCNCECGKEVTVRGSALISGNTKSCGCLGKEQRNRMVQSRRKKGVKTDSGKVTVEYDAWRHIRGRCNNVNNPKFRNYGGRGIKVCERWNTSFENFLTDMGVRPYHRNSIERINVDGDYEPGNCKWATEKEQAANKTVTIRIIVNGTEIHQAELARQLGVNDHTISRHLSKGKTGDEIVEYFKNKKENAASVQ